MNPQAQEPAPSPAFPPAWRQAGVDFDRNGTRTSLKELLDLGGFFPLARIKDRVPFSPGTLRRWARTFHDFGACIITIRTGPHGRTALTLIDLNRLNAVLCARIAADASTPQARSVPLRVLPPVGLDEARQMMVR